MPCLGPAGQRRASSSGTFASFSDGEDGGWFVETGRTEGLIAFVVPCPQTGAEEFTRLALHY
jgi:hypothetical protein